MNSANLSTEKLSPSVLTSSRPPLQPARRRRPAVAAGWQHLVTSHHLRHIPPRVQTPFSDQGQTSRPPILLLTLPPAPRLPVLVHQFASNPRQDHPDRCLSPAHLLPLSTTKTSPWQRLPTNGMMRPMSWCLRLRRLGQWDQPDRLETSSTVRQRSPNSTTLTWPRYSRHLIALPHPDAFHLLLVPQIFPHSGVRPSR